MLSHIPNRPREITLQEMILAVKAISALSCLGMFNYYHRFLPDVATVLEPLH